MLMNKKKIYITGIAGFIGFHLARRLKALGHEVRGCDNFNDYYDPRLKEERATLLDGIPIDRCDIRDLKAIPPATHLVHLAAQAGVRASIKEPKRYVDSNLDGFVNILEICRHAQPLKFIFASSSSVYGDSSKVPFSECDPCDKPVSLYAATKRANELLAYSYHHLYRIPTIGLRFFTVYGPYGRPDMAYYSFAKAIFHGEPIEIFNNGEMERDFTYIDDIVEGIVATLDYDASFEIFNLGNNHPEKLIKMIALLEQNLGKEAIKIYRPMQLGDVKHTFADLTKSRRALNFTPKTSLEEGIAQFSSWFLTESYALTKID